MICISDVFLSRDAPTVAGHWLSSTFHSSQNHSPQAVKAQIAADLAGVAAVSEPCGQIYFLGPRQRPYMFTPPPLGIVPGVGGPDAKAFTPAAFQVG